MFRIKLYVTTKNVLTLINRNRDISFAPFYDTITPV